MRPAAPGLPRPAAEQFFVRWWPAPAPLGRPAAALWWLHPLWCVALVGLVYASFSGFQFARVVPNAYIPGWHYAWGAALLAALAMGIAVVSTGRDTAPAAEREAIDLPRWATGILLAATLLAYAIWFAPLMANPQLVADIVSGARSNVRDVAVTTPGLTTMTQFGVAYVIACAVLAGDRARPLAAWERFGLAAVLALATLRALVWSERLAVIELALTYVVARLAFTRVHAPRLWHALALLPLVAPLALYLLFTGTEYFRSWEFFRTEYDSIWVFSLERLLAYYATASNNGIGFLVEFQDWPHYTGRFVAEWLHMMPVIGEALRESIGDPLFDYGRFLARFARPEFNNPSGLFPIVFDIGYAGSALYFVLVGLVIGACWRGWRRRSTGGLLFYPTAVLFLSELLRFNYFASTRFFPAALALLLLWAASRPVAAPPGAQRW